MMREATPHVAVSTPVWPAVAPGWQGRLNSWITRYPEIGFRLGARDVAVRWTAPRPLHLPLSIRLQCAGYNFCVSLSGLDAIDSRLVGEPFTGMPRNLRTLVVSRLVTECVAALPSALAQGIQLLGIDWHEEDADDGASSVAFARRELPGLPTLAFECCSGATGAITSGAMAFADAGILDWVLDRFGALAVRKLDGKALTGRLSLRLGSSRLAPAELAQLETGGFVWIDDSTIGAPGIRARMQIRSQERTAGVHAFIKQRRVMVTDSLFVAASPATGDRPQRIPDTQVQDTQTTEASMKIDLSKLELQLDFELGDVMLPVGEIEKVGPGYVFELPQDVADSEVLVRVSGKVIAVGEIVAVGRRLGVRITRMEAVGNAVAGAVTPDRHAGGGHEHPVAGN
ncbi:MAG TPA: FliM/FliN family flagellar motor switch protein [Rhodocyclaceae bacterium]|nr:FliM/FliN family flagellar motor switch protein [Rhodocyclaceae bacterium]